ncbi:MAG: hypothetical protein ACK4HW_06170 [Roseinatronobacter sp.]
MIDPRDIWLPRFIDSAPARPKRIVFTGDILRPSPFYWRPTQHHNVRWLRNILSHQLRAATGLPDIAVSWGHGTLRDGGLGEMDVRALYAAFRFPPNIKSWATIYGLEDLPPRVEAILAHLYADALVIGFELPPYLETFLTRRGIPYVSFTIHPVRFLDDLLLGLRSNVKAIQDRLFAQAISEPFIHMMAGIQKASAARYFPVDVKPGAALMVMQTPHDQSQLRDGVFLTPADFLDQIADLAAAHSEFLIKEHPIAPNPATPILQARIPNARMVTGNIYGFMAIPEIKTITTLSSSVRVESEYFGVQSRAFLRDAVIVRRAKSDAENGFIGIEDAFLNSDFWRDLLDGLLPVSAPDGMRVPPKNNRLRISLRAFWNFNEIDSDVAASLVKPPKS